MMRKLYYYIIAITLGIIALYFWTCVFILKDKGIYPYNTTRIQNLIVLLIVLFHTAHAKKTFKILNFILLPITVIGFMLLVMHWPFARLLFFVPSIIILAGLLLNNSTKNPERLTTYFILTFPSFHLLCFYIKINHFPGQGLFSLLDFILMGIVSIAVSLRLYKMSKQTKINFTE